MGILNFVDDVGRYGQFSSSIFLETGVVYGKKFIIYEVFEIIFSVDLIVSGNKRTL